MTAKRNFKRRVRERQARTGESYVTARRRLLAAREAASPVVVPVVQLRDATAEAARMGFRCRIAMEPALCERAAPMTLLAGLRDTLVGSGGPGTAALFARAFGIPSTTGLPQRAGLSRMWPVYARLRMELGRAFSDGPVLVFRVVVPGGTMAVLCMALGGALALMAVTDHLVIDLSDAVG